MQDSPTIAVLDIGDSKTVCFVGHRAKNDELIVTGIGQQRSKGIRAGQIVDIQAAQETIGAVLHAAEANAQVSIDRVVVGITSRELRSRPVHITLDLSGGEVGRQELRELTAEAWEGTRKEGEHLLHAIPMRYTLDGVGGIEQPLGMAGKQLDAEIHLVSITRSHIDQLRTCLSRCHVDIATLVAAPFASGLGCLNEEAMQLGATVLDIGSGTTQVAVFSAGKLLHVCNLPIGSRHISQDIAAGLQTPIAHAETLKIRHGHALLDLEDPSSIEVRPLDEEGDELPRFEPRTTLNRIIQFRAEEILEMARNRLEQAGLSRAGGGQILLTGGGSQLDKLPKLAERVFGRPAKVVRPRLLVGAAESMSGPAYAQVSGLIRYAASLQSEHHQGRFGGVKAGLGRLSHWLRSNI